MVPAHQLFLEDAGTIFFTDVKQENGEQHNEIPGNDEPQYAETEDIFPQTFRETFVGIQGADRSYDEDTEYNEGKIETRMYQEFLPVGLSFEFIPLVKNDEHSSCKSAGQRAQCGDQQMLEPVFAKYKMKTMAA